MMEYLLRQERTATCALISRVPTAKVANRLGEARNYNRTFLAKMCNLDYWITFLVAAGQFSQITNHRIWIELFDGFQ